MRNDPDYNDGPAPLPEDTEEISTAIMNEIFRDDRNDAIDDAVAFLEGQTEYDGLSDERREVIVNMAFNMGRARLNGFAQFRQALQDGNYETAMQEMLDSDWSGQVGDRALRLGKVMQTNDHQWFDDNYFQANYEGELDEYLRDDDESSKRS